MTEPIAYERPSYASSGGGASVEYENPRAPVVNETTEQTAGDRARTAAVATGAGAAAGAGAFMLRGLLRKAFPGIMPKTSALKSLDAAIKRSESGSGLKKKFSEYMGEVSKTDKPLTFADFMAQQSGHSNANAVIKDMIANSGDIPKIDEKLSGRAAGAKERVLDDIANALGVPKQSVVMGKDALIESRKNKAQPLYDAAFKDDAPIRDTRFFSLFEAPAARRALKEAMTNAENRLQPIDVRAAANPRRKDWWKRMSTEDIPEGLFIDEETPGGLRKYIAPNMRNADAIQKALRQMMEEKMVKDPVTGYTKHTEASRAVSDLHRRFMDTMYDAAPTDTYRQAREAYAGDSKLLDAHKVGSELLTMTPDELRKELKGMGADERTALAQGFYGSLNDMKQQKFLRELIARPERYPEVRAKLGAVFPDKAKLDQFLENLRGESAMTDSAAVFGNPPPSSDAGPRLPSIRMNAPLVGGGDPRVQAIEYLRPEAEKMIPRGKRRAAKAGTDMLFGDPSFSSSGVSHPDWGDVNRTPLSPLEISLGLGKSTGAGAVGGLGLYGASQGAKQIPYRGDNEYFGQ